MLQVMSQAIVVPSRAIDPGSLLEDFLAVPAVRADHFKLFGFVPTLAALLATRQACVLNRASADDEVQVIGPRALIQQLAPIFTVS